MPGISGLASPALSAISRPGTDFQATPATEIGTAMLGKSLDLMQTMGDSMTKMMEQSVNPGVGGNIDMSV